MGSVLCWRCMGGCGVGVGGFGLRGARFARIGLLRGEHMTVRAWTSFFAAEGWSWRGWDWRWMGFMCLVVSALYSFISEFDD